MAGRGLRGRGGAGPAVPLGTERDREGRAQGRGRDPLPGLQELLPLNGRGWRAPALSLLPLGTEAQPRGSSLAPADSGSSRGTLSYCPAAVTPPRPPLLP